MRILIVAATELEINPILKFLNSHSSDFPSVFLYGSHQIEFLISGIGSYNTVFELTRKLCCNKYDLVINAGIAGSFNPNVRLGTVFQISMDRFGDVGAENADGSFSDIFEMGLIDANKIPYTDGWLRLNKAEFGLALPEAKGYTTNRVTGTSENINGIINKYHPDVETMEGAAFIFTCLKLDTVALQIRAISNFVEPRNKDNWNIPVAIKALNDILLHFITGQN